MAHYLRFEVYVPSDYVDATTGERRHIPPIEVVRFCNLICKSYGGVTQTHPVAPPPLRRYWKNSGMIEVDDLTVVTVLVPLRDQERAVRDLSRWKRQLERRFNQKLVLVMYHPVQTLDEL